MKTLKLYCILLSAAFLLVITNCTEREWNNPLDANINSTVTTSPATEITSNSAILGGNVTSQGGSAVTERGICYSTTQNPTTASTKVVVGSGTGEFSNTVTGLTAKTTYYVRAYATNSAGTAYGEEISFTTTTHTLTIGDAYQGGIVAYILLAGDPGYIEGERHGLIAAPSDQSTSAEWGCYGTEISGAEGTAIGTGNQNTIDIMAGCSTTGIAARLCGDLILGGYGDWYLPSRDELRKLYINKAAIGGFAGGYWSSSEDSSVGAWLKNFANGDQFIHFKDINLLHVRAIRAF